MELVKVEFKDGTISEGIMFNNASEYFKYLKYISNFGVDGAVFYVEKQCQDLEISPFTDVLSKDNKVFFTNTIPESQIISSIGLLFNRKDGYLELYKLYDFISHIPDDPDDSNNDIILKNVNITTKYTTRYGLDIFNNYAGILTEANADDQFKEYNKYQIFTYASTDHMRIGIAKEVNQGVYTYNFYTKETINFNIENKIEENALASANSINIIGINHEPVNIDDVKDIKGNNSKCDETRVNIDTLTPFVKFKINGISHYGIIIYQYHHLYNNLPKQSDIFIYPVICTDTCKGRFIIKSDLPKPDFYIITTSRIEYCNNISALNNCAIDKITDISIACDDSKEIASSINEAIKDFLR